MTVRKRKRTTHGMGSRPASNTTPHGTAKAMATNHKANEKAAQRSPKRSVTSARRHPEEVSIWPSSSAARSFPAGYCRAVLGPGIRAGLPPAPEVVVSTFASAATCTCDVMPRVQSVKHGIVVQQCPKDALTSSRREKKNVRTSFPVHHQAARISHTIETFMTLDHESPGRGGVNPPNGAAAAMNVLSVRAFNHYLSFNGKQGALDWKIVLTDQKRGLTLPHDTSFTRRSFPTPAHKRCMFVRLNTNTAVSGMNYCSLLEVQYVESPRDDTAVLNFPTIFQDD